MGPDLAMGATTLPELIKTILYDQDHDGLSKRDIAAALGRCVRERGDPRKAKPTIAGAIVLRALWLSSILFNL
jgi:hypothetical protein